MGIGDELLAAGRAMALSRRLGVPVRITNNCGQTRYHPVWEGNPHITLNDSAPALVDCGGHRAYIRYPFTSEGHGYTNWRARDEPARLYLTEQEIAIGEAVAQDGDFVVIEPHIKAGANVNKRWGNWQEVVDAMPGTRFVQMGPIGTPRLRGVTPVLTTDFRAACGVLASARGLVASEGGLHHAAAALGVRAVVIFGGSPSEQATGYDSHVNLGGRDPCGRWKPCPHCAKAMAAITPEIVVDALKTILERQAP